jgi:hypothetical protein
VNRLTAATTSALNMVAAFFAVALVFVVTGAPAALAPGAVMSPDGGPDLLVDGCIVRLLSTGPVILDDANHHCSPRVTGVSVVGNDLHIAHDPVTEIVSASVSIDETLTQRGVIAGASAGFSVTVVRFFDTDVPGVVAADSGNVTGSTSNVFVTWMSVP